MVTPSSAGPGEHWVSALGSRGVTRQDLYGPLGYGWSGHRRGGACQRPARSPTSTRTCTPTEPPLRSWGGEGSAGGRPSGNLSEAVRGPRGTRAGPRISWRAELRQLPATGATSQEPVGLGRETLRHSLPQCLHACSFLETPSFGARAPPPCAPAPAGRAPPRPQRAGSPRFLPGAVGAGGIDAGARRAVAP